MASLSTMSMTWLAGLALICVALVGGGIEIKEIKIPSIGLVPRILSFVCGSLLLALGFAASNGLVASLKPFDAGHVAAEAHADAGSPSPSAESTSQTKPDPAPATTPRQQPTTAPPPQQASSPPDTAVAEQSQAPVKASLTADEIRRFIVNQKFRWEGPRGGTGTFLYKSDGRAEFTNDRGSPSDDAGTWTMVGDTLCVYWKRRTAFDRCIAFEMIGSHKFRTDTGFIWTFLRD